jgi:hypothetical protein
MTAKTKPDFYSAAMASKEPRGDYATAREMLDDLPAIVMQQYGKEGAATASCMIKRHKKGWGRSDRDWFDRTVAFAANALRNPDLTPDMKVHFELMVFIAGVFDAAVKRKRLGCVEDREHLTGQR